VPASSAAEHASEASVRTGRESGVGRGGGGGEEVVRYRQSRPISRNRTARLRCKNEGRMFEETGRKDGYQRRPIWKRRVKTQPTELD